MIVTVTLVVGAAIAAGVYTVLDPLAVEKLPLVADQLVPTRPVEKVGVASTHIGVGNANTGMLSTCMVTLDDVAAGHVPLCTVAVNT